MSFCGLFYHVVMSHRLTYDDRQMISNARLSIYRKKDFYLWELIILITARRRNKPL